VQSAAIHPADGGCTTTTPTARQSAPWHTGQIGSWEKQDGGGPAQPPVDTHSSQDFLPPAREETLQGAPQNRVTVPSLSPEGMSAPSHLWDGPSFGLNLLSPCLPYSFPHVAELLEVAASAPLGLAEDR
jgi:hypothetical protein